MSRLITAAKSGDIASISSLIRSGANPNALAFDPFYQKDGGFTTPLIAAVMAGEAGAVRVLASGKADINAKDQEGFTPLHRAVQNAHLHMILVLLSLGGDINALDAEGKTPLIYAVINRQLTVLKVLAAEETVNFARTDRDLNNALHHAVLTSYLDGIFVLARFSPRLLNYPNKDGLLPLHIAANVGNIPVLNALIEVGANLNAKSFPLGQTALHLAASRGDLTTATLLLYEGAEDAADSAGNTPLKTAEAALIRNDAMIAMLKRAFALIRIA